MKREYLDQLAVWFHEEVEGFKAEGASEEILREPAFTSLLVDAVFKKHVDENPFRSRIYRRDNSCALSDCIAERVT